MAGKSSFKMYWKIKLLNLFMAISGFILMSETAFFLYQYSAFHIIDFIHFYVCNFTSERENEIINNLLCFF